MCVSLRPWRLHLEPTAHGSTSTSRRLVRLFQAGTEPVAVIAIGAKATGVIAIGPYANGVLAIGQLAVGVVAIGQLSLGLLTIGQVAFSPVWAFGQLVVAPLSGGAMLPIAPLGKVPISSVFKRRPKYVEGERSKWRTLFGGVLACCAAAAWWFLAAAPLLDEMTRVGGMFRDAPRVLK